ncbi:MAG: 2-iminoacetate synthase ThiH [Planctomycetota bacterium]|jgi:2-iminoacetate synthase
MFRAGRYIGPSIKEILQAKRLDGDGEFWRGQIEKISGSDVEKSLAQPVGVYSFNNLLAFISPAAEEYLERMAQLSRQMTIQRFGRTIRLYAPLYLSNYCVNSCLYCGFNRENEFERKRLTLEEAVREAEIIASKGFSDILLVSSEDRELVNIEYLTELAARLRRKFSSISAEIYRAERDEYARLFASGIEGVTIYQETYDRAAYAHYHPAGPKSDYDNRLTAPDDIGSAGMREIGVGVLLGLTDWRMEALALAEHIHYLMKRYWQSHVSLSFPRLRPAYQVGREEFKHLPSDRELVQMIIAMRLCFADVGLVISTRERAGLRDCLIKLGITKVSAASKTSPGGYSSQEESVGQFEVDDKRSAAEVAAMIRAQGSEAVWKDWDRAFGKDD